MIFPLDMASLRLNAKKNEPVPRSPFPVPRSPFSVLRSPFSVLRSRKRCPKCEMLTPGNGSWHRASEDIQCHVLLPKAQRYTTFDMLKAKFHGVETCQLRFDRWQTGKYLGFHIATNLWQKLFILQNFPVIHQNLCPAENIA